MPAPNTSALILDDAGGQLFRSNTFLNITQDFTVSWWMYQNGDTPGPSAARAYYIYGDAPGVNAYLYVGSPFNVNTILIEVFDGVSTYTDSNEVLPVTNVWMYATLQYKASTHTLTFLLEGIVVCTLVYNLATLTFATKNDTIGNAGFSAHFAISNMRQWQAFLTPTEILLERKNYLAQRLTNLLTDSPLSTIYGSVFPTIYIRDESGNGHNWSSVGALNISHGPFLEGSLVQLTNVPTFNGDEFDPTTYTLPPNTGAGGIYIGLGAGTIQDTGLLPASGIVIYSVAIWNCTLHQETPPMPPYPPHSGVLSDGMVPANQFNGGAILEPHTTPGGTSPDGTSGWAAGVLPPTQFPISISTTGTNNDYIEPRTLLQWRRDRVFQQAYGGRGAWWNPNSLFTFYSDFLHLLNLTAFIQYATITEPALQFPPVIPSGDTGTIVVHKITTPSSPNVFGFTTSHLNPTAFNLSDGEDQTFSMVPVASTYSITESPTSFYSTTYTTSNASLNTALVVGTNTTTILTVYNTFLGPFSGIYYIHPEKTNDTLFASITATGTTSAPSFTTTVVPIPNPFILI